VKAYTSVIWLVIGVALGFSASELSEGLGFSYPLSPNSLLIMLPLIGISIYFLTLPIFLYRRALEKRPTTPRERPNPFYAVRVLVLSRAIILTAAGFFGWHLGGLIWLSVFSISPEQLVTPTVLGLAGSFLMLAAGYLGEFNCRAPKSKDEEVPD
jgi:sterol desaturase/sphingolipid hydroxylase (fatty acid hydroxylase superfamily)